MYYYVNVVMVHCFENVYTIKFEKRSLPHYHISMFLEEADKIATGDHIDKTISYKETQPHFVRSCA